VRIGFSAFEKLVQLFMVLFGHLSPVLDESEAIFEFTLFVVKCEESK
jgi:hypothetical protein